MALVCQVDKIFFLTTLPLPATMFFFFAAKLGDWSVLTVPTPLLYSFPSITPLKSIHQSQRWLPCCWIQYSICFFFCLFFWGICRLWHNLSLPPHWNNLFPWLLHFSDFPLTSMAAPSQISLLFAPHQHGLLMLECFRAHSSNFFSVHIHSQWSHPVWKL